MNVLTVSQLALASAFIGLAADLAPISQQARATLDRTLGAQGAYVSEESAYKFVLPRNDLSVRVGSQRLSPVQAPASWVTFSPAKQREAFVNGEFVAVEDEVNPIIAAALKAGLAVTGLGPTVLTSQPLLLAINLNGDGTYQSLGTAVRRVLDEMRRVRSAKPNPSMASGTAAAPPRNAIDPTPLNRVLSMRGNSSDGIFRAAIGRVEIVNGTPLGREMGMSTKLAIFGTNERAFLDADFILNPDELQRVLLAMTTRNRNISAISNHLVGQHPSAIFVRVWG